MYALLGLTAITRAGARSCVEPIILRHGQRMSANVIRRIEKDYNFFDRLPHIHYSWITHLRDLAKVFDTRLHLRHYRRPDIHHFGIFFCKSSANFNFFIYFPQHCRKMCIRSKKSTVFSII